MSFKNNKQAVCDNLLVSQSGRNYKIWRVLLLNAANQNKCKYLLNLISNTRQKEGASLVKEEENDLFLKENIIM